MGACAGTLGPMRLALVSVSALLLLAPTTADAKTCKAGKVPVTVGKKTTCKPLATALPNPKPIDLRLAHLQEALKFDPAKGLKGKKRKRIRTLQSGFGAAGKRVQKKLLKMLPKALAFVDRKGGTTASRLPPTGLALASAGCDAGPAGPTGQANGGSLGALGDNGGYMNASAGGGMRVRVTFVQCKGATNFRMPECPTANGSVDATATGEFRVTLEIWDGDRLVERHASTFEDKAKTHGEVGPDAKLKFIDVEHTQELFIVASGGVVVRGGVTRKVRIAMPGGKYDPAAASVRHYGDSVSARTGADSFASTAGSAISVYKEIEPRWSTFNPKGGYCAEAVFSPASNTLKLKKNDRKQLSIYAKARQDGGRATGARWTLLGNVNADFSPGSSESPAPDISYTVTNAPNGGEVKVTVKFTSTAGVGEGSWTQPTETEPTNHLVGSFSGEISIASLNGPSVQSWSGTATLVRNIPDFLGGPNGTYQLESGGVTYHVSGQEGLGVTGCQWSGTHVVQLPVGMSSGSASVLGTLPEMIEPYGYSIQINTPPLEEFTYTRHDCPEGAKDEWEGKEETIPFLVSLNVEGESPDGVAFSGSQEESFGGYTARKSWNFEAKP